MKITEKLYITRLEGMLKKYKGDPCPHCPMAKHYDTNKHILTNNGEFGVCHSGLNACRICRGLTEKYARVEWDESIKEGWCPCSYFQEYFDEGADAILEDMPKDYMVKIAWKVVRGWKKDNKQETTDGIDKRE